jgi:hypothetical protein
MFKYKRPIFQIEKFKLYYKVFNFITKLIMILSIPYNYYISIIIFGFLFILHVKENEKIFLNLTYKNKIKIKGFKNYTRYFTHYGSISFKDNSNQLHDEKNYAYIASLYDLKIYHNEYWLDGILVSKKDNYHSSSFMPKGTLYDNSDELFEEAVKTYNMKEKISSFN